MNRPFSSKQFDRQTRRVLLIEGPGASRDRHAKTLARNGYDVLVADNIEAGRSQWSPKSYGLVVVSLNGFGQQAADFCDEIKERDSDQVIALIFSPDDELPVTTCATLIFTTEPDEYFLARVETLTAAAYAA
jgi:response regulator RpfG family c-di-GMP phosphodiesterase